MSFPLIGQLNKSGDGPPYVVSVVIPSTGRASLGDAIKSVRRQTLDEPLQLIVVFDLADTEIPAHAAAAAADADVVLYTGGGRRGCYARNLGVKNADSPWVAFLDDDDEWEASKLLKQLDFAERLRSRGKKAIVGSRTSLIFSKSRRVVTGVPAKLINPGDVVEDYLFRGRRPGSRRASFFTSSILADKNLCDEVPWDEALDRHQDWDWLVRAGRVPGVQFVQVPEDLVLYKVGSEGSISARDDWKSSFSWARTTLSSGSRQAYVDFLAAQTARYALQMGDYRGVGQIIAAIAKVHTIPMIGPVLIGLAGMVPRRHIHRVMAVIK